MSSNESIRVSNVSKLYRQYRRPTDRLWQALFGGMRSYFTEYAALTDVDFSLAKGEAFGVVGVNGAGKSTLLQLIAGTVTPTSGSVTTRGRIAALLELGSGFNPEFTGRENIYFNAATLGLDKREIDARIEEIIAFADIGQHIDQPVKTYSSGMYVRLAFSIATSVDPDILIVDEALSVGDGAFARKSFDRILKIRERGTTVLFCSHVLFHVEFFCDRALWLHEGKVQEIGLVSQVLGKYQEFLDSKADGPASAQVSHASEQAAVDAPGLQGFARIDAVRVQLNAHTGVELYGEAQNSTLAMEVDFVSDPDIPSPTVAIVISSDSGRILTSNIACAQQVAFSRDATGRGTSRVVIESLPLNKGRYRVGTYLMCERGVHVYQWIDPVAHLNLHREGLEPGYFLLNAQWTDGSPGGDINHLPK